LFFQWSLCRNRFSINRCSYQFCRIDQFNSRTYQFCSRFAGICCANQSLHRLSSQPAALCRSLLVSSLATYRYRLFSFMTSCSSTSHGPLS
jgi:hypothetical protein